MSYRYPKMKLLKFFLIKKSHFCDRERWIKKKKMKIYDTVKRLSSEKNISIYRLEKDLGLANGAISKWNRQIPNALRFQEVADYLGVTTSYILNESRKG